MIRASVVVPACNAEATLLACLEALKRQTLDPDAFEIVVVDDGSGDATCDIANRQGVTCVRQENQGPAAARNHGARIATGDILLFTDADCEPAPDWVEKMLRPFRDTGVAGVQGAYRTRQTSLVARFAQAEFEDRYDLMARYDSIDLVATYAAAFRRKLFLDMGGFDTGFPVANNEDTDFSYRLVAAGHRLVFAPEALVYHRHPETLGDYLRTKFWRAYWRLVVYRRYPDKAFKDRYTTRTVKLQTLAMLVSAVPATGFLLPLYFTWASLAAAVAIWLGILASAVPFARRCWRQDKALGLAAPFIVWARAAVFAVGSAMGLARCLAWQDKKAGSPAPGGRA